MKHIAYVEGLHGLGDNIYQRAFVRDMVLDKLVMIRTPWPQLYMDLENVSFVYCQSPLRTQAKNVEMLEGQIAYNLRSVAEGCASFRYRFMYGSATLAVESITDTFRKICQPRQKLIFDLPTTNIQSKWVPPHNGMKYIVVKPPTVRHEWKNPARNPNTAAFKYVVDKLRDHYTIISVADVDESEEYFVDAPPESHIQFHRGELDVLTLIHLVRHAAACVGGVSWMVPMSIATGTPMFCMLGGNGMHNAPEKITDQDQDTSKMFWHYPDNFCRCDNPMHNCDKYTDVHRLEKDLELFCTKISG